MDKDKLLKDLRKDKKLEELGVGVSFAIETPQLTYISTGNLALDWCLSGKVIGGGLPVGRIVELFGDPSAGKSLILSHVFAETQKMGGVAILDDTENSHDPEFMSKLGVNPDELVLLDAVNVEGQKTIEAHIKAAYILVKKMRDKGFKEVITLGLDSIAGVTTEHEIQAGMDKQDMARAKQIRKVLRMYAPTFAKMNVLYIMTNHTMSTMSVNKYQPQVTTPGGGGPKFWASLRIYVRTRKFYRDLQNQVVGGEVFAKVEKTKMTSPFRECTMKLSYTKGIDRISGLFDVLQIMGDITSPSPGWYCYKSDTEKKLRQAEVLELLNKEYGGVDIGLNSLVEEVLDKEVEKEAQINV